MRQKSVPEKEPATEVVKNIRRATRRHFLSGRQDPHCTGRPARRGQYRRALPPRGDRPEPLLPLVERLSRGREEATGWRYGPGRDLGRGQGPASRGQRAEGGRGRAHPRKSSAQKKRDGGWGGSHMRYPASEKFEIIRLVEESALPVRRTLEKIGIPRATFYRCRLSPPSRSKRHGRVSRGWHRRLSA